MKHKVLSIFYIYIFFVILIFLFFPYGEAFFCSILPLLVLVAFYIAFKKRITKRIITCFLLILIFQVLLFVIIDKFSSTSTLVATTDNINQANKVQNVLLDNNFFIKVSKDGTKYEVFAICTKNEIDNIMIILSESDAINQNVGLELFDKGDFTTTRENKKIKLINHINNKLTVIIKKIEGVENAFVSVSIPEQSMFAHNQQPITANIDIETKTEDVYKYRNIEKTIKNLLLSTITGLTENNIKIKIKVVK